LNETKLGPDHGLAQLAARAASSTAIANLSTEIKSTIGLTEERTVD
jgi:hypothetical protein